VDQVATRTAAIALLGALLSGCAARFPARVTGPGTAPSPHQNHRRGQAWQEPPGWRLAVSGIRCGAAAQLAPGDLDSDPVCVVDVVYTNDGDRPRSFTGTTDEQGPTWRISGYDAQGHEFHGHARQVGTTPPGATGHTDLIFELPGGITLQRVLIATGMVDLSGAE